ncbi:hypothetical protein M501DRAFT_932994 [Patellaria atrata CBS 101060]|uniref:Uncharacterized protein n=1 Tax=Patellaria atrata CBS 101060 TaxID=1346257 RepID=A0A9P4VTM7_9PEZI|nr:hypothetical protein M501DRAFT_932994 [Patellaria atrata CBS 101060]
MSTARYYEVYKASYRLGMQDPLMLAGPKRFHNSIFVVTNADGSGWIHHVVGDLVSGCRYERKKGRAPQDSDSHEISIPLGRVRVEDYPQASENIMMTVPPPPRQRMFNPATYTTMPCKPDGTFYKAHETPIPYWKYTEWTEQKAIPALLQSGLIHPSGAETQASSAAAAPSTDDWVWDQDRGQYRHWDGNS